MLVFIDGSVYNSSTSDIVLVLKSEEKQMIIQSPVEYNVFAVYDKDNKEAEERAKKTVEELGGKAGVSEEIIAISNKLSNENPIADIDESLIMPNI